MKYTRYDIKKRRGNNFFFGAILIATLIFALIIGTIASKILFKSSVLQYDSNKEPNNAINVSKPNSGSSEKKIVKYIAVQGGVYKNSSGAEAVRNSLMEYGSPFTVEDDKGIRVILGIYNEENGLNKIKALGEKNISNAKVNFEINVSNNCDSVITAIISNELDILIKLDDKSVKYIETEKFKEWVASFEEVEKDSKNYNILTDLKAHVNSLSKEITKDMAAENYKFIYGQLKKLSAV